MINETERVVMEQALVALDDTLQMLLPKEQRDKVRRAAHSLRSMLTKQERPVVNPEEGAPGEAGLRWAIGNALSTAIGNPSESGLVGIDPFDSDDIDPLVNAVIGVLRDRSIPNGNRPNREWYAHMIQETLNDDFVVGTTFKLPEQAEPPRGLRPGEPPPPLGVQVPQCDVCVGCREWGGNGLWHHAGCPRIPAEHSVAWLEPAPPASAAAEQAEPVPAECPFCGMVPDMDDPDTMYPTGTMWMPDDDCGRRYFHRSQAPAGAHNCYSMHCVETAGGCGVEMHGDTAEEVLARWNRRSARNGRGQVPRHDRPGRVS